MLTDSQGNVLTEQACGLAGEVVRSFGEVRLRVFGTSMVPAILPGDLVSIHRASLQDVSLGDVVLFLREGRLFAHRVVDRKVAANASDPDEAFLITRGDRLRHADAPVSAPELLGRVVSIERDHREARVPTAESNSEIVRLLLSSELMTSLYLWLVGCWRSLFLKGAKCQA
jgi:signal peptidase I